MDIILNNHEFKVIDTKEKITITAPLQKEFSGILEKIGMTLSEF